MPMTFKSQIHPKTVMLSLLYITSAFLHKTFVLKGQLSGGFKTFPVFKAKAMRILSTPPQRPESDPSIPSVL